MAAEALRFAREHLGPATEHLFMDPAVQALVRSRWRSGIDLEDAILGEVQSCAAFLPTTKLSAKAWGKRHSSSSRAKCSGIIA
jgi:hypothetical protein